LGQRTVEVHRIRGALDALRGGEGGGSASEVLGLQHLLEDETSNPMANHAMEMLGCGHAFHRKCITK
jgi:hypothetical protein